jgi:hypothetical protein
MLNPERVSNERLSGLVSFAIDTGHDSLNECIRKKLSDPLQGAEVRLVDRTRDNRIGCDLAASIDSSAAWRRVVSRSW